MYTTINGVTTNHRSEHNAYSAIFLIYCTLLFLYLPYYLPYYYRVQWAEVTLDTDLKKKITNHFSAFKNPKQGRRLTLSATREMIAEISFLNHLFRGDAIFHNSIINYAYSAWSGNLL